MKIMKLSAVFLAAAVLLAACGTGPVNPIQEAQAPVAPRCEDAVPIVLSDQGITVDGAAVGTDAAAAVYTANDIVYYESGKGIAYGEGSEKDAHSPEEAAAHTVLHITKPGAYSLSGKLSLGQIAVDLGDGAKKDPNAVVTLVLNGVDITCTVAPAVIFYNVYECGKDDPERATKNVDTSAAGANVVIADGTVNTVRGSYVAKIYEPESVVWNDDQTEVKDAKKLHKYDGAFYSRRSLNLFGGKENTGVLNIEAENEGLDSEMHLTVNGGMINIASGNDGINTNEDGISVTTVNGGRLTVRVTGETGEGDGIDSNGWLVINGGTVIAAACGSSADAGIDSDMGIHINGGTVIATGHMLDRMEDGGQNYAVFQFSQKQTGSETVTMKEQGGETVLETKPVNAYSVLVFSSPELKAGIYTLWSNEKKLAGTSGGMVGGPGMRPGETGMPAFPGNMQPPGEGNMPPEGFAPPQGGTPPEMPGGSRPGNGGGAPAGTTETAADFVIRDGGNMFGGVSVGSE